MLHVLATSHLLSKCTMYEMQSCLSVQCTMYVFDVLLSKNIEKAHFLAKLSIGVFYQLLPAAVLASTLGRLVIFLWQRPLAPLLSGSFRGLVPVRRREHTHCSSAREVLHINIPLAAGPDIIVQLFTHLPRVDHRHQRSRTDSLGHVYRK